MTECDKDVTSILRICGPASTFWLSGVDISRGRLLYWQVIMSMSPMQACVKTGRTSVWWYTRTLGLHCEEPITSDSLQR